MSEFEEFMVHSVTVSTKTGSSGMGALYAAPELVQHVFVDEKRRLVRDKDGAQVVCEATLFDEDMTRLSKYAPDSKVVLPSGRPSTVIGVAQPELDGVLAYIEVTLT
jgi:hypothetical protein